MSNPLVKLVSVPSRRLVPTAAIASAVLAPLAMGASGDLDPSFGDGGRIGPIIDLNGPAWSLEIQDDERIVFAGGDFALVCGPRFFCDLGNLEFGAAGFIDRVTASGLIDSSFNAPSLVDIQVLDIALQSDDKIVAVGRYIPPRSGNNLRLESRMIVFRLGLSGLLDQSFGSGSLANLPLLALTDDRHQVGTSVLVDSNGRIVIAGIRSNVQSDVLVSELIVLRLLTDGSFDETFGNAGLFIGPAIDPSLFNGATSILQTAAGGYRLTMRELNSPTCQILALTEGGAVDDTFGIAGMASVVTSTGDPVDCKRMALADSRLVVTGSGQADGQGFVTRLLANGESDPGFTPGDVLEALAEATALAVDPVSSIVIGGIASGLSDVVVMRLQASGALDQSFGNAGTTLIDLPTDSRSLPVIHELTLDQEDRVVAAGGNYKSHSETARHGVGFKSAPPFLVRLSGENDGASPGIVSIIQSNIEAAEPDQAVVNVRRTGGKTGNVSVAYATVPAGETPATGGQDYGEVADRLTWDDGDESERQIVVQVFDNGGVIEEAEEFRVELNDAQGGAGLGTRNATVSIRPDGEPNGQFSIQIVDPSVSESGAASVRVQRNYYFEGAVSVTLTPIAGTATAGDDFIAEPVTLSWADNDVDAQTVEIALNNDTVQEGTESFTVELSNSTGGAVIGPRSTGTITIEANDAPPPPPPPPPRGGGGAAGLLSLLLLGLAEILASLRRSART